MANRDDEALSWSGDDDPTLDAGAGTSTALPAGYRAVGKGSDGAGAPAAAPTPADSDSPTRTTTDDAPAPAAGNAALVTTGILVGVYLLWALGWLIGGMRLRGTAMFLIADAAYTPALILAVAAPLIWFVTAFVLTRAARSWVRFSWLIAGVVLLVPWPFIMVGAVGQ